MPYCHIGRQRWLARFFLRGGGPGGAATTAVERVVIRSPLRNPPHQAGRTL